MLSKWLGAKSKTKGTTQYKSNCRPIHATKMKMREAILLLAGLAGLVAGDGHLRGVPREAAARRLETSGTYKVFFFEANDSNETLNCSETVEQLIDDDYGLEVVRLGEEPLDPVIIHEFTVCNETFVEESIRDHDEFIYMQDSKCHPQTLCLVHTPRH